MEDGFSGFDERINHLDERTNHVERLIGLVLRSVKAEHNGETPAAAAPTSASRLLAWPSIKKLTRSIPECENIHPGDFPLRIEERRGIPRLYGRGEGHGRGESAMPDYCQVEMDTYSEPGSSPADSGCGSVSPQASADYKSSTLNGWGQPDYTEATVNKYVRSCEANVLNLHPIIDKESLRSSTEQLLASTAHTPVKTSNPSSYATFTSAAALTDSAIGKRKRCSPTSDAADKRAPPGSRPGAETAVTLAALALGKLSLHSKNADVDPSETKAYSSPIVHNGQLASPAHTSPSTHPKYSRFTLPRESGSSRRQSWQSSRVGISPKSGKPNHESFAGLENLYQATGIVDNLDGRETLQQIQANLLIALYYGQIGYVIPSLKHINIASRQLQAYMRCRQTTMHKQDNLMLLMFWTCLQLESNIVLEPSLPHSGILSSEVTPIPLCDEREAVAYMAHVHFEKALNCASKILYSKDPLPGHATHKVSVYEVQELIQLETWLPTGYRFEAPASDILSARLHEKYWPFRIICTRPFIKMILDFSCQLEKGLPASAPIDFFNLKTVDAPYIQAGTTGYEQISQEIVKFAKDGIKALIKSTKVFHTLGTDRLLSTNFFGTAIAQWGNLLVLAACYQDRFLRQVRRQNGAAIAL